MGIAFITAKAKKFKHQRDAAFEDQIASPNLLSALPEQIATAFRCKLTGEQMPNIGTRVLVYGSGEQISVFEQNKEIGQVMSPDFSELRRLMEHSNTEALAGVVSEVHPMSGVFLIFVSLPAIDQ